MNNDISGLKVYILSFLLSSNENVNMFFFFKNLDFSHKYGRKIVVNLTRQLRDLGEVNSKVSRNV